MQAAVRWVSMFTWELPQTIVGAIVFLVLFLVCEHDKVRIKDQRIFLPRIVLENNSFSLGHWVFFDDEAISPYTRRHELGHSYQSYLFGPLYLVLVAIPSVAHWVSCEYKDDWEHYYDVWPENNANYLGGNK